MTGAFGGITTTAGGRNAATEAGVTNFGAGGSAAGLVGGGTGFAEAAEVCSCASIDGAVFTGVAAGGFARGRAGGCSTAPFCWIARNTSPGREMWERSILVLISSST